MSGLLFRRRPWRRVVFTLLVIVALAATAGTLVASLQVKDIQVAGARQFPAADVTRALDWAMGVPTVTLRADDLRSSLLALPWVADAAVRITLDGSILCTIQEKSPAAVAIDGLDRLLLDELGTALGAESGASGLLELSGFAGFPDDRAAALAVRDRLESHWGAPLLRLERRGLRVGRLTFADTPVVVDADLTCPEAVQSARAVLAAWSLDRRPLPSRLDVRVPGRVVVQPSPAPEDDAPGGA